MNCGPAGWLDFRCPGMEFPPTGPGMWDTLTAVNISEYAERVLFSEDLAEKLRIEGSETVAGDENRGTGALPAWLEPGRPRDLVLRSPGSRKRAPFPPAPALVNEESRGRLFHFFANHELMAAELMALALLKFPEAPPPFRQGLLQTLREEQRHTRWYVDRMRECGVEFGIHPLSRYFWDMVATMETPMDYVARLSLTFEQANLDYARHFGRILREAGDSKSSKILDRIYRDEIGHVRHGLEWFRKWKDPGESDWEAFQRALVFPLSPSRAKGNGAEFNSEGRLEAGLDEDFVRSLAVFERSRGRTPNVFWFNPDAEDAMAAGLSCRGYHRPVRIDGFIRDLEGLPVFLARRDDVVVVKEKPRQRWLERLRSHGFALPEFEKMEINGRLLPEALLRERKVNLLRPWAWCPQADALFRPLAKKLPGGKAATPWGAEVRDLFSKSEQARIFRDCAGGEGGIVCETEKQIDAAVARIRAEHAGGAIAIKAPFAASGRGLRRLEAGEKLAGTLRTGVLRLLIQQGSLVLEPWRERVFDFSAQFEMGSGGLRRLGFTRQVVDEHGGYRATVVGPKFCRGLPADLASFLMREALPEYEPDSEAMKRLAGWLREAGYAGPVGVDAFVYRDGGGELRRRVICEVNPRHTMGRLAWELSRKVAPGRWIRFEIVRCEAGIAPAERVTLNAAGLIDEGTFVLNDTTRGPSFAAVLTVAREVL